VLERHLAAGGKTPDDRGLLFVARLVYFAATSPDGGKDLGT
jgi:hypothetical protein